MIIQHTETRTIADAGHRHTAGDELVTYHQATLDGPPSIRDAARCTGCGEWFTLDEDRPPGLFDLDA